MLFTIDAALVSMARGGGAIDLAIGETLAELEKGDRLIELGFSQLKDYLHGLAGLPPSTYYFYLDLADALSERPLLRRAVVRGLVTPRKALLVAPLAEGEAEAAWAAAAARMTEKELRLRVQAVGIAPELDTFEIESFEARMTVAEQAILDEALAAAKWVLGMDKPRWMCLQAIATEWLSGFAEHVAEPVFPKPAPEVSGADAARLKGRWYQELSSRGRALEEVLLSIDDALDPGRGLAEEMDGLHGTRQAKALHARVMRLFAAKNEGDEPFGRLAKLARDAGLAEALGFVDFEDYCRERLGLSPGTVKERIRLEERMQAMPALRKALVSGVLTYTKLVEVARKATPSDVGERIAAAAETTWQEVRRRNEEQEDEEARRRGRRRFWGPKDAMEPVHAAIAAARRWSASEGVEIGAGAALARMAYHFLEVWRRYVKWRRSQLDRVRREVLLRRGGLCAVPNCSRAAVHVHHIRFRSRGGGEQRWNLAGTCWSCHERGIHRGRFLARGRAGERIEWEFAAGDGVPLWRYETIGPAEDRVVSR